MKTFEIDLIRQIIEQTINREHYLNPNYIGGKNDFSLLSFYEHLQTQDEVNRFVETVRDLNEQQNRTNLILNGTIVSPENVTITNINNALIVPLSFTCNFRCRLEDRDIAKETLDNMVDKLKGRIRDVAVFDNGKVFMVGTYYNNSIGKPQVRIGDFLGSARTTYLDEDIKSKLSSLTANDFADREIVVGKTYYYYEEGGKLKVAFYNEQSATYIPVVETNGAYGWIDFPPEHESFKKYIVTLSFDGTRCSEPRTLNSKDYCDISFGGSATIVSPTVMLGNRLTKLSILPYKIIGAGANAADIDVSNYGINYLEPLELPSGLNMNSIPSQLVSNNFKINSHNDGITPILQYTFIYDRNFSLLKSWFKYGRYGIVTTDFTTINNETMSPNIIYKITEIFSSWANNEIITYYGKLYGDINIENTESDVLTISVSMQVQGGIS